MLERLRRFLRPKNDEAAAPPHTPASEAPPEEVRVRGDLSFSLTGHLQCHEGYPIMDWAAVQSWVDERVPAQLQAQAWSSVERGWLLHFKEALGHGFHLSESESAALLSSLAPRAAQVTLDYVERTLKRVERTLDGLAQPPPWGKDLLIVFDDAESYYRYVSFYYPEAGEFAFSSGMHIQAGCSHYVTIKGDLHSIEPVIAHEMTHGCLGHLPLPAWLNEGLAVNTERRLASRPASQHTPQQLRQKHLAFWGTAEVQEFWCGKSFLRTDDGNELSYDLARILVEHMAKDWAPFKRFVLAAQGADAGAQSAREHLGIDLGSLVCALLEQEPSDLWAPDPLAWSETPERGGFRSPTPQI